MVWSHQTNRKLTGLSVLTSYFLSISFSFVLIHQEYDSDNSVSYFAAGCTKWSPTVISMASAPLKPQFQPFHTLDWLGTAILQTILKENQWFTAVVCPPSQSQTNPKTAVLSMINSYLYLRNQKCQLKAKHLIMKTNVQNDLQRLDQQPQHLEFHISSLVVRSNYWLKHRYEQGWWKTDYLPQRSILLYDDKQIENA